MGTHVMRMPQLLRTLWYGRGAIKPSGGKAVSVKMAPRPHILKSESLDGDNSGVEGHSGTRAEVRATV